MKTWFNDREQSFLFYLFLFLFVTLVGVIFFDDVENVIGKGLGLPGQKNAILTFLGLSMGGVLLVMQTIIANTRAEAMEDAAREQAKANENTERGQRQERLKNAIEHLGHDSISIRMGGAYELFHLAQDTKELRKTVLDILCAHIRQTTGESGYREEYKSKPSEEIQSLLTLLFVQDHDVFKGLRINLQGSWLNGAKLSNARLHGANLSGSYLQETWLQSVRLLGADLFDAMLREARLDQAQVQGANLGRSQFQGAYLWNANLQGTDLWEAKFQGAMLLRVQLQGAFGTPGGPRSFEARIRERIGKQSELTGVTFIGGINQEDLDSLTEGLPDNIAEHLRAKLNRRDVDEDAIDVPPEGSDVNTGSYTKEEAEQWIAEYKKAVSEVLEEDDS